MRPSIGIVIPTLQAEKHLPLCLAPLLASDLKPRILLIDSSSTDNTVPLAKKMGAETITISRKDFNHGTTREMGRKFLHTPIVVMITQDAYVKSSNTLEDLVTPLIDGKASISYAKQLPHEGADFFARFAREFNYPLTSHIRGIEDAPQYGVYTFFCSNSCAAYVNHALDEINGFPNTLFGEDTIVTAKLLHRGHRIAYVSEAEVFHSHNYTLFEEFQRHMVMGKSRRQHKELLKLNSSENRRGSAYAYAMLSALWKSSPHLIPYGCAQLLAKFSGYHLGGLRERLR
jgi:rhamnosyltransferase